MNRELLLGPSPRVFPTWSDASQAKCCTLLSVSQNSALSLKDSSIFYWRLFNIACSNGPLLHGLWPDREEAQAASEEKPSRLREWEVRKCKTDACRGLLLVPSNLNFCVMNILVNIHGGRYDKQFVGRHERRQIIFEPQTLMTCKSFGRDQKAYQTSQRCLKHIYSNVTLLVLIYIQEKI